MSTAALHPVESTSDPAPAPPVSVPKAEKPKKDAKAGPSNPLVVCPCRVSYADAVHLKSSLQMNPPPEYLDHRIKMFDRLKAEYDEFLKSACRWTPALQPKY